jgi:hypothetical protein
MPDGELQHQTYYQEAKANKECASWLMQHLGGKRLDGEVVGTNPDYAFRLQRKTKDSGWYESAVVRKAGGRDEDAPQIPWPPRRTAESVLLALYRPSGKPLSEWIRKTEAAHSMKAATVHKDGRELVRVEFDTSHPPMSQPFEPVQSAAALLDPSLNWCVVQSEAQVEFATGKYRDEEVFECVLSKEGFPIPKRSTYRRRQIDGPVSSDVKSDYDLQERLSPPPNEEFRLPAYGLPDPVPRRSGWSSDTRTALLLGVLGVGLVAAGAALRKLRSRKTRPGVDPVEGRSPA